MSVSGEMKAVQGTSVNWFKELNERERHTFWAAFGARVRRINAGLEAKWRRTASR